MTEPALKVGIILPMFSGDPGKVLEAAGGSLKNVVMLRSYFVNIARDLPVYRKVRKECLSKPYPASTAVGVTALAIPGLQIEIEAVAVL